LISDQNGFIDRAGHGTHCAGILAGTDNGRGIVGIAPRAKILAVKVLGDNGSGTYESVYKGFLWAAEKADIISMSLGSAEAPPDVFHQAVKQAYAKNVVIVAAAGNEASAINYPAAYDEVIGVVALDKTLLPASFSNRGAQAEIAAPGVEILSAYPGGRYAKLSGTSMSTPIVSGIVALYIAYLKKKGKPVTVAAVRDALAKATVDLGPVGRDPQYGYGLINAVKLIN